MAISNYKYTCNESYFETIDTEDKAYWLGFIYADGNVHSKETRLRIMLHTRDAEHLFSFLNCIDSNQKTNLRRIGEQEYIGVEIARMKLAKDLIEKGCVPSKTFKLQFPSESILPRNLQRHFIRGYFDGDGCLSTRFRPLKTGVYLDCVFKLLGTHHMLENIIRVIPIDNIKLKKNTRSEGIYEFMVYDPKKIIVLMDYLYEDCQFFLRRKHDKYISDIKHYKKPSGKEVA